MIKRFGSTSDMIIQSVEENGVQYFLAIDEKGLCLATQKYLDSDLADPNRYSSLRVGLPVRLAALQLDAAALAGANHHRVKKIGEGDAKKKINLLKTSKCGMKA